MNILQSLVAGRKQAAALPTPEARVAADKYITAIYNVEKAKREYDGALLRIEVEERDKRRREAHNRAAATAAMTPRALNEFLFGKDGG